MTTPSQRAPRRHPNKLPRPKGERKALEAAWELPQAMHRFAVNNTVIGYFYVGTRCCASCSPASWRC